MAQPIGVILQELADFGLFFYILPFLLVFALVYAIMYKTNIMGKDPNNNKGVYAIISIAVALLSLQFESVPIFFQIIFPKLGIALSIILATVILMGLFVPRISNSGFGMLMVFIGGILGIIILLTSFNDYSWWTGSWWQTNISAIVMGVIILVFIFIIIGAGKPRPLGQAPSLMEHWGEPNIGGRY